MTLLPFACDAARLRTKATAFAASCEEAALEAVLADPERLMRAFKTPEAAAAFQSSLIGTTTFQQSSVTRQLLRALVAGREGSVLRDWRRSMPGKRRAVPGPPGSVSEEPEQKSEPDAALSDIKSLKPGERIRVGWVQSGEVEEGEVVEVCEELVKHPGEQRVRVRYGDRVLYEHLWHREWERL